MNTTKIAALIKARFVRRPALISLRLAPTAASSQAIPFSRSVKLTVAMWKFLGCSTVAQGQLPGVRYCGSCLMQFKSYRLPRSRSLATAVLLLVFATSAVALKTLTKRLFNREFGEQ